MKLERKAFCGTITDSIVKINISTANARCALVQNKILTVCVWKEYGKTLDGAIITTCLTLHAPKKEKILHVRGISFLYLKRKY